MPRATKSTAKKGRVVGDRERIEELVELLVPLLSVQGWDFTIEYRQEVVINGEPAEAAIAIFPALLEAVIFVDETLPLARKMRAAVHEFVHLSQHELIYVAQELDIYLREPELSILGRRLSKALEPACIRVCRPLYEMLGGTFPELLEDCEAPLLTQESASRNQAGVNSISSKELRQRSRGTPYTVLV